MGSASPVREKVKVRVLSSGSKWDGYCSCSVTVVLGNFVSEKNKFKGKLLLHCHVPCLDKCKKVRETKT